MVHQDLPFALAKNHLLTPPRQHIQHPRQYARVHDMSRQHDRPDRNRMRVAPSKKNAPRGSVEHDGVYAE